MAVDTEDWCHVMFLHSSKVHGPTGVQFCWDPSGQSLGDSAPPRGCCTEYQYRVFPAHHSRSLGSATDAHQILVLPIKLHCWPSKRCTNLVLLTSQTSYLSICLVIPWGPTLLVSCQILHIKQEPLALTLSASLLLRHGSCCWWRFMNQKAFSCLFSKHPLSLICSLQFLLSVL